MILGLGCGAGKVEFDGFRLDIGGRTHAAAVLPESVRIMAQQPFPGWWPDGKRSFT